jgi:Immunity protein 61
MSGPTWTTELKSWAGRAGYSATSEPDAAILYSEGGESRYYGRLRDDGWCSLTFASRGGDEHLRLAAATIEVIERYLFGVLGAVLRDESGLPILMKPYEADQVATGFHVSGMSDDGYRTLDQDGVGPVAVARDEARSLLTLIPLSHYLRLTVPQLQQSFLSQDGSPLMRGGEHYAPNS